MIALIAYGIGNRRSVQKALEHVGAEVTLTSDPEVIITADRRTHALRGTVKVFLRLSRYLRKMLDQR